MPPNVTSENILAFKDTIDKEVRPLPTSPRGGVKKENV
jgi:hypothetical protein